MDEMRTEKTTASEWFSELQGQICAAFEALENDPNASEISADQASSFEYRKTERAGGGGGKMAVMRGGRVFEKVGVNVSAVHGELSDASRASMMSRKDMPGLADDPRFWASGISLVAHMQNPHAPAVHMNTRMFWTPSGWWFGGGTDLNPALPYDEDTAHFHGVLRDACDPHDASYYPKFKEWADEYFYIPHRKRARGVGGIFYDDLCNGDWDKDFAFTKAVGQAFLPAFLPLAQKRAGGGWTDDDRDAQLCHRGLYAEYNLVYDRGTKFGLASGHDPEAVLMSLPPLAKWV